MLQKQIAQEVIDLALSTGGDFAEIFMEDRFNHVIEMNSGKIEKVNSLRKKGAGIRVFNGFKSVYIFTNDTSKEGLLKCAKSAAASIKNNADIIKSIALKKTDVNNIHFIKTPPFTVKSKKKIEKIRSAQSVLDEYDEIKQATLAYADSEQNVLIANSEGLFVQDMRTYSRFMCSAVASNGTENQTAGYYPGAMQGFEIFDNYVNPSKIAKDCAQTAIMMLHAPLCPAGIMPVVIDSGFGGVVFHEACGHSLEATSVAMGSSEFCDKMGEKIASDCVTAIDDGTIPNQWGSSNIDDEGTPTNKLVLIENGTLKNYMIDKFNGRRMNMSATGSSRRESYEYAPTSRMRNTYIAAGNDDEKDIIASMGDGLYAKSMGGGSVNPATGEFNFAVNEAYIVKDGKIANPVRGASLIGRGSEILFDIDKVGKNVQMAQGMCGSLSGSVPVNIGQAMIRIKKITVGGH